MEEILKELIKVQNQILKELTLLNKTCKNLEKELSSKEYVATINDLHRIKSNSLKEIIKILNKIERK